MNIERWEQTKDMVKKNFELLAESEEERQDGIEKVQIIEFKGPLGRIKLEFVTRPRVLDKKTTYTHRVGAGVKVDYIYSDKEKVYFLKAFKYEEADDNWVAINPSTFNN